MPASPTIAVRQDLGRATRSPTGSSTSTCTSSTRSPRRRPSRRCAWRAARCAARTARWPRPTTTSPPTARRARRQIRDQLSRVQVETLERELRGVRRPGLLDRLRAPGHRARDRPGAGRHPAGHDDRLRRLPHLHPRRLRRARLRHRHERGRARARHPDAPAAQAAVDAHPLRRRARLRRHGQGPDPRARSARSASTAASATWSSTPGPAIEGLSMEGRMTVCNMTIEGGGRAGMIAPDDTTFEWVEGRAGRARGLRRRRRRAGASCAPTTAPSSTARSTIDASELSPAGHLGHDAGHGHRRDRPRCPSRSGEGDRARARVHGARGRHADPGDQARPRLHRLLHQLAHRRPARRRRGRARAARSPAASTRWSCPARAQVKAQAEAEGLDEVFLAAGFDWRSAGCSMCLGMNPDIARPGRALRLDLEPQLRGPPGPRRPHPPGQPADGRRGRDRGPLRRHPGVELHERRERRSRAMSRARPRRRRHRPDHPQAVPQARRADRLRRVPVLRLGARSPAGTCRRTRSSSTGRNFGCGSSREHAPWALEDYGFKAIVAPSFADIFYSNCTKIGLLPVTLPEDEVKALMEAGEAAIDLEEQSVVFDGGAVPLRDRPRDHAPAARTASTTSA